MPYFIDMARIPNPNKQLTVGQGVPLIFECTLKKENLEVLYMAGTRITRKFIYSNKLLKNCKSKF